MTLYPVRSNSMTTSLLAIIGDLIARSIEQRSASDYARDTRRTVAVGIWGLIFMEPMLLTWYTYLDLTSVVRLTEGFFD